MRVYCLSVIQLITLQWCHNERGCFTNHQSHDCLLNRLCRCRSKKISKLRVTGLCVGNSPVTGEFPAQRASNVGNVSIWWHHHEISPLTFWCWNRNMTGQLGQYHGCWCPGSLHSQDNHYIDCGINRSLSSTRKDFSYLCQGSTYPTVWWPRASKTAYQASGFRQSFFKIIDIQILYRKMQNFGSRTSENVLICWVLCAMLRNVIKFKYIFMFQ